MNKSFSLGAARWTMPYVSTYRKLIAHLTTHGYKTVIDTSILYGESEKVIPLVVGGRTEAIINTKFSALGNGSIDGNLIYAQYKQSKSNLKNLNINTYFLHSVDPSRLTSSAMKLLVELKEDAKIQSIGFSGDNDFLRDAIKMDFFDAFMFSFSPLDMNNFEIARILKPESIYIKRVIGSGALKFQKYKICRRQLGKILGESWAFNKHDYHYRLRILNKKLRRPLQLQDFVQFGDCYFPGSNRVFGVSSLKHLYQIMSNDGVLDRERRQEIHNNWKLCAGNSWTAIV